MNDDMTVRDHVRKNDPDRYQRYEREFHEFPGKLAVVWTTKRDWPGVFKKEVKIDGDLASDFCGNFFYYDLKQWHSDYESALEQAEVFRRSNIIDAKRTLERLENYTYSDDEK